MEIEIFNIMLILIIHITIRKYHVSLTLNINLLINTTKKSICNRKHIVKGTYSKRKFLSFKMK